MMEKQMVWKECTQKIFWGVVVIAVAGIFNTVYDYLSIGTSIFELLANMIPRGLGSGMTAFFTSIKIVGGLAKVAIVVGYVFYLLGLTQFTTMQTDNSTAVNIHKVRTAVIILICCFGVNVIFGIMFKLPLIGSVFSLAIWIATLVAYYKMKNAFGFLTTSPAFSVQSQLGAKKLRYAALCNIRLMLMPIVVGLVIALIGLIAFSMMSSSNGIGGIKFFTIIGGFLLAATVICALVFMFFALVYPFIGWYKIMNGGPSDNAQINTTTDMLADAVVADNGDTMKSAKASFDRFVKGVSPKLQQAKTWAIGNKKFLEIGVGAFVVVVLLAWLIPKFGGSSGVAFETLEIMDDEFQISIDIPQGNSEREQNVTKGIREIITQSEMCKNDVIGAPIEGSIQEIIADCQKRYHKFADNYCKEYGAPAPPICQLFIESGYQNKACVTFQVDDGVYFNGSPDTRFCIIRFSDGHIMELGEMVFIKIEELETIAKKYYNEEDGLPLFLEDGFNILPSANDSCRLTWPVGHGYGEVMIPLNELENHLTEEGKEIFMAEALDVSAKKESAVSANSNEAEEVDSPFDAEGMESNKGLLQSLPVGTTEYVGDMAGFPIEFKIIKDSNQSGVRAIYKNVNYKTTFELEGESLPVDDGNISFVGRDPQQNMCIFNLTGNADNITGTADIGDKKLNVSLHRR